MPTIQQLVRKGRATLVDKSKAPALNAKDGAVAIEEMQIAYETLKLES